LIKTSVVAKTFLVFLREHGELLAAATGVQQILVNGRQQGYALSYARPMQELRVINDDVMGGALYRGISSRASGAGS